MECSLNVDSMTGRQVYPHRPTYVSQYDSLIIICNLILHNNYCPTLCALKGNILAIDIWLDIM